MLERLMQWSEWSTEKYMERETKICKQQKKHLAGLEPATSCLPGRRSIHRTPTLACRYIKNKVGHFCWALYAAFHQLLAWLKKRPNKRRILNLELRTKQGRTFMIFHNEKQFTKKNQYLDWLGSFHMWPYVETAWPKKGGQGSICLLISDSGH